MTFSNTLIHWYEKNARALPWRNTKDAYRIWISEIILQQTRVEQGLPYYHRFIQAFPNVQSLHQASEDQVLKMWEGLGYYSRARNMKFAAHQIVEQHQGIFPDDYKEIIALKGIGPYTAAAIASMAFDLPYAVVDGNVFRVLSRYFGIETPINSTLGKKEFDALAQKSLIKSRAATYNQAIMEFGALFCKPKNPDCVQCPLMHTCTAFASQKVDILPIKLKTLKIKERYLNFILLSNGKEILIEKRIHENIWKGLYQLPLIETETQIPEEEILIREDFVKFIGDKPFEIRSVQEMEHKLTHRLLKIRFLYIIIDELPSTDFIKLKFEELKDYAFPKPVENYLNKYLNS
ncbi:MULTISPECIES: A/G-specific adenine glycosylase [unclassified Lentimicrobium]|uniref:A/G-specific adenine glycosylase n=1 Tax=unclassified Lentimicrobium TaxID=2677434 RepID=UPI001552FB3D|nr:MULTISPECIES: A/G-specific adenine glycosylase [unclassified Lentimicrobium]NPD47036.1 A/G-specific adenine glycosylase [Lentimicrobium sp. S6]NPD86010.1 A/G-specific adenine glycosylase [Lentimicrobium sp. L6]